MLDDFVISPCVDCKYFKDLKCIHEHAMHCKYCELWTPKWFDTYNQPKENARKRTSFEQVIKWLYADIDELIDMDYDTTEKGGAE